MAGKKAAKTVDAPRPKGYALKLIEAANAIKPITERIANGESYRAIAKEIGVTAGWLSHWLEDDPERSHAAARAREQAAQMFDEMALEAIDEAADPFELTKAREKAIHFRWKAKAANPKRYGDKVDVNQETTIRLLPDEALDAEIKRLAEKIGLSA